MAVVELTGVPFDGYGRTGNQALALVASASWSSCWP